MSAMEWKRIEARETKETDVAGGGVSGKGAPGGQSSKAEIDSGIGVNRKSSLEDQSSMTSAGGLQKKRKAVVRKEFADTQEYESRQQDWNKSLEELAFVPSAVSDSAAWRDSFRVKYMCDKKCNKEGFKFCDIAAILVEDDGKPHTINLCRNCYSLRLGERSDSKVTNARWDATIEQEVSRGKLSAACFVNRMLEKYPAKKLWARPVGGGNVSGAAGDKLAG